MTRKPKRRLRRDENLCLLPHVAWEASQPPRIAIGVVKRLAELSSMRALQGLMLTVMSLPSGGRGLGDVIKVQVTVDGSPVRRFAGHHYWTLHELIQTAEGSWTSMEHPAPQWNHDVCWLPREGAGIQTVTEKHDGPCAGTHARSVLRSRVEVHQVVRAGEKRHAA